MRSRMHTWTKWSTSSEASAPCYDTLKDLIDKKQKMLENQRERVKKLAEDLGSNNQQALVFKQQLAAENRSFLDKELIEIRSKNSARRLSLPPDSIW